MSEQLTDTVHEGHPQSHEARRRQLRAMLVSAADTARQTRQTPIFAAQVPARPMGLRIRERITRLLNAVD